MYKKLEDSTKANTNDIRKDYETPNYTADAESIYDGFTGLPDGTIRWIPHGPTLPCKVTLDIAKMPSYIRDVHFAVWFNKFNQLLKEIGLSEWALYKIEVSITFSDKLEKRKYGSLSLDEIKQKIKAEWGDSEKLDNILSEIHDKESFGKLMNELMGILRNLRHDGDRRNPEKICRYLNELEFEVDVLGKYRPESRQIVLYTKNIEKAAGKHKNPIEREFEKVFAHELFHAYHYYRSDCELTRRQDYTSNVVKESLASAFEWFYCNETKISGCDSLEKTWRENLVEIYPYSGAINLLTFEYKNLNKTKFEKVFTTSLKDVDGAMRELLYHSEFYNIKNATNQTRETTFPINDLENIFETLECMSQHYQHIALECARLTHECERLTRICNHINREREYIETSYHYCQLKHGESLLDWLEKNK